MGLSYLGQVIAVEPDREVDTKKGKAKVREFRLLDQKDPRQVFTFGSFLPHGADVKVGDALVIEVDGLKVAYGRSQLQGRISSVNGKPIART